MKNLRIVWKRLVILLLVLVIFTTPTFSKNIVNMHANITSDFSTENIPEEIQMQTIKKVDISKEISIPQRSIITAEVYLTQKERRWHKSGYIICKLKNYLPETETTPIDVSEKEIYLIARKYEKFDKKEATILSVEIILTQAASFFAPGVDLLYFFTKGAIKREKNPNWFKAGVSNAYDNSICWFWLKGKPIELSEGEEIQIKDIKKAKADTIKAVQIKKEEKQLQKVQRKEEKLAQKAAEKTPKETCQESASYNDTEPESVNIIEVTIDKAINSENNLLIGEKSRAILVDTINEYTGKE